MSTPAWELTPVELPFEVASMDPTPSPDPVTQDAGFLVYPQAGADEQPLFASSEEVWFQFKELVSTGLNFVPILGQAKGAVEGFLGQDLISGRHLADWERVLNVASAASALHGAHGVLHVVGEIGEVAHKVNMGVHAKHGWDVYSGSSRSGGQPDTKSAPTSGDPLETGTGRLDH